MSRPLPFPVWLVRLVVRIPVLARLAIRFLVALPPSRLKTRLWHMGMQLGFTASDRRDWEVIRTFMGPDARFDLEGARQWTLGLDAEYRGVDGYIRWFEAFTDMFEGWNSSDLEVIAPAGNRVLVVFHPRAQGAASGVEVSSELSGLFTYERGWLVSLQGFGDSDEALAAIGLKRRT